MVIKHIYLHMAVAQGKAEPDSVHSGISLAITRLYRLKCLPHTYDWGRLGLLKTHMLLGGSVLTQQLKDKKSSKTPCPRPSRY